MTRCRTRELRRRTGSERLTPAILAKNIGKIYNIAPVLSVRGTVDEAFLECRCYFRSRSPWRDQEQFRRRWYSAKLVTAKKLRRAAKVTPCPLALCGSRARTTSSRWRDAKCTGRSRLALSNAGGSRYSSMVQISLIIPGWRSLAPTSTGCTTKCAQFRCVRLLFVYSMSVRSAASHPTPPSPYVAAVGRGLHGNRTEGTLLWSTGPAGLAIE